MYPNGASVVSSTGRPVTVELVMETKLAFSSLVHMAAEAALLRRILPGGGFSGTPSGKFQADSTAWGILAFHAREGSEELREHSRGLLAREQIADGRVCIKKEQPESYWPTPLAILAWQGSVPSYEAQQRAIRFLLSTTGWHFPRSHDAPWAHDTLLRGWPWVDGTHSWIEPTSLCIMALQKTGNGEHERVREAVRMLLDRQLPHGGWNYGNTLIFRKELHPMPESTGAALAGLAGLVEQDAVRASLTYLQQEVTRLRTPISLGWSLLGLAAWQQSPSNAAVLVERCLVNQERYGEYETSALCLLILGALAAETGGQSPLISAPMDQSPSVSLHH